MPVVVESELCIFRLLIIQNLNLFTSIYSSFCFAIDGSPQHEMSPARFNENWKDERISRVDNFVFIHY